MHISTARHAALLLLGTCATAQAGQIFKCVDATGAISYQATPCAEGSVETPVAIQPSPPPQAAPQLSAHDAWEAQWKKQHPAPTGPNAQRDILQKIVTQNGTRPAPAAPPPPAAAPAPAPSPATVSYECKDEKGDAFYRHRPCPAEVWQGSSCAGSRCVDYVVVVKSSRQISREDACHELHRAGAGSRPLHAFDEPPPDTYDKNLGRDPCR